MTKQEKQLLLIDLCARLPYGVKISFLNGTTLWTLTGMFESEYNGTMLIMLPPNPPKHSSPKTTNLPMKDCKPYLRPMSSMTEEERLELSRLTDEKFKFYLYTTKPEIVCYEKYNFLEGLKVLDWLNAHHFDYRGLIPLGLALEATVEMYK